MTYPLVASQKGVFALMRMLMDEDEKYRGIPRYIRENFVLLRTHAEELARFHFIKDGVEEVTLAQVYDALKMTGELSELEAKELMNLEQDLAEQLSTSSLLGEEEIFEELAWLNGVEEDFSSQLLAGAAMRAMSEGKLEGASRIGASLGGPILMPYVEWLLRRSEALGFKRLYFIARDGYILKLMADALIERLGMGIKTHYIHGSRKAWRMPSYLGQEGELRGLVGWSHIHHICTAEDLAEVMQMPVEKLRPYLVPEFADVGRQLTFGELAACVLQLDRSEEFHSLFKELQADRRQLAIDYLRQEVDTSDDNFAFVELGGGGFTQICLANLMQDFYGGSVRTFFYKMDRVRPRDTRCVFYDFFPSKLKNDLVIEMVCRAAEGQTEGYQREGKRVIPVKKEGERDLYLQHGYDGYVKGILAFVESYKLVVKKYRPEPSLKASLACMNFISAQEDNYIMEFFAGMPNSVTGREKEVPSFAPELNRRQLQEIFIRIKDGRLWNHYQGTDFGMSIKRSSPYIRRKAEKYKKHGGEIRERWLSMFPKVRNRMEKCYGVFWNCPYSWLGRKVVIYGAGKRGRKWHDILAADTALEIVQWLDKDYLKLKDEIPVTGDMQSLGQVEYDWVMTDFADPNVMEQVLDELQQHGVAKEKIYTSQRISEWISKWINYLHI